MLDSLITGARLISTLSGQPDTTNLEKEVLNATPNSKPKIAKVISINSETNAKIGSDPYISTQRTNIKKGKVGIDWDSNKSKDPNVNPPDVSRISVYEPFNINKLNVQLFDVGNTLGALGVSKGFKINSSNVFLNWGAMIQKGMKPLQWAYANADNGDLYAMLASLYPSNITKMDAENSDFFGIAGKNLGKAYASIGASHGPRHNNISAAANTHGLEDFGVLGLAVYNPKKGNFFFKTKTALGDVDQKFYRPGFANFANGLFVFPPFFKPHFSPTETKGKTTLTIDGSGTKETGLDQFEVRLGRKTRFGMIGAGVYNGQNGPVPSFAYYFPFNIGDVKGSFELTGNRTTGLGTYLTLSASSK